MEVFGKAIYQSRIDEQSKFDYVAYEPINFDFIAACEEHA